MPDALTLLLVTCSGYILLYGTCWGTDKYDIKEIKKDTFDYIIASGIFAVNIENAKEKDFSMIEELFM